MEPCDEPSMGGRALLGAADVSDEELTRIATRAAGVDPTGARVVELDVEPVDYAQPAITTAGLWWVRGSVESGGAAAPFSVFVKQIQSWARSPLFAFVPPELQEFAEAGVPWRTEYLIYRSDLADRLPDGLSMPRALHAAEIDDRSASLWLEAIDTEPCAWTPEDFREAAYLVGRLNASASAGALASIGEHPFRNFARTYVSGRVAGQIEPALRDDRLWEHPLLRETFGGDLRDDLRRALDAVPGYLDELDRLPLGAAHGDTCPNNLLRSPGRDGFVLIDFGFWSTQPLGFDLAQLVFGDVQLGRTPASSIPAIEAASLDGYVAGIRDEGSDLGADDLRRGYLLKALIYVGLSALPFEDLDGPLDSAVVERARERAAIARYLLEAVHDTAPIAA